MIRILGIDPGLRVTGFGVVDADGPRLRYVASGVVRIGSGALPPRLKTVHEGVAEVIREYRPQVAAVEIIFVNVNPRSTLLLGQARGAAITAAAINDLVVHEYTALQVKQAVVGYGRAAKSQIQAMVQSLLGLPGMPSTDAADALACAICHAHVSTMSAAAERQLAAIAKGAAGPAAGAVDDAQVPGVAGDGLGASAGANALAKSAAVRLPEGALTDRRGGGRGLRLRAGRLR